MQTETEIPVGRRRSRLEIEYTILDKARSPIGSTNLMFATKSHGPTLQRRLLPLIERGFLDVIAIVIY